jgi:crotonobetainyl-CoA:carnitine CoA-transferase CaiB-like acyl-CoA transferase
MPVSWNDTRSTQTLPPPLPGEHSRDILRELGLEAAEIDDLRARGIISSPDGNP